MQPSKTAIWLAAIGLCGCSTVSDVGEGGNLELDWILPAAAAPGDMPEPVAKTVSLLKGDYLRIPVDVRRTVKRLSWGLLRVVPQRFEKGQPLPAKLYAEALLENERKVVINIEPADKGMLRVAVRAGLQGDAEAEQQFIDMLQTVLNDQALRDRGGRFKLPKESS